MGKPPEEDGWWMRCWQHATPRRLGRARRQNSSLIVMYRESEEKREMMGCVDGTDDKGEGVCGGRQTSGDRASRHRAVFREGRRIEGRLRVQLRGPEKTVMNVQGSQ